MPTKMAGYTQQSTPYTLRNYHGKFGVTAYVPLDKGQEVTIARLSRDIDKMLAFTGEIVDCYDTTTCRVTFVLKVNDPREFVREALGAHHVLVYGDYIKELRMLCQTLGIQLIEV
jgi:L-fucose isomerase-like protein